MATWVQGHNERMGFKAIVCHDGGKRAPFPSQSNPRRISLSLSLSIVTVFSTSNTFYSTDELYFPEREFGGTPWEVPENYSRWNPQNHIHKWKTPQLIIRE